MAVSFFWYDLETSGINPRDARIMQFAGQRTDMDLRPVGEPVNMLVRMTEDTLPEPDAVLLTGITPQMTIADGVREAEFLRTFNDDVATPGTIFVGYNSVHFDDEFMRFAQYRNFYDPYEWQWQDGRSRWDLLNVIRMTRALRPDGITWPVDVDGKPTNRLELLTVQNGLDHANAHDALGDVQALITLARLLRNKQVKLFEYLLQMRDKKKVAELVAAGEPFVHTSGSYSSAFEKTTVALMVGETAQKQSVLVYDLRYDPLAYKDMSAKELADLWRYKKDPAAERLPVTVLAYNRCPAVAPLGVLDAPSRERLQLDLAVLRQHRKALAQMPTFAETLRDAQQLIDKERQVSAFHDDELSVDARLYEGFFGEHDRQLLSVVRVAAPEELGTLNLSFDDERLAALLPLYAARNFPKALSTEQRVAWESFCKQRLMQGGQQSRIAHYLSRLQDIAQRKHLTSQQQYLLEELRLYGESIVPNEDF
jgi:exodeoxyribonuclease I